VVVGEKRAGEGGGGEGGIGNVLCSRGPQARRETTPARKKKKMINARKRPGRDASKLLRAGEKRENAGERTKVGGGCGQADHFPSLGIQ